MAVKDDRPVRVLLVEDHPTVAELTMMMLRDLECEPALAASVAEARALGDAGPVGSGGSGDSGGAERFDLLLTDMRLPDGSGLEIIRHFADTGIKAVLLTAYSQDEPLPGSDDLIFDRLSKPVDMGQLADLVGQLRIEAGT